MRCSAHDLLKALHNVLLWSALSIYAYVTITIFITNSVYSQSATHTGDCMNKWMGTINKW